MARVTDDVVQPTIAHVLAILAQELPEDLREGTRLGAYFPGLIHLLPFISVTAESTTGRTTGLGRTIGLKRTLIDGSPVDLGYITGDAGACQFTLTLWAVTRPQLVRLREAIERIPWLFLERTWEEPPGTLNRALLLRCRLRRAPAALAAPMALAPRITVRANNLNLRTGPSTGFDRLGQANNGDQFELLGRTEDGTWVQGCCFEGQVVWMAARFVETSVPLSAIPVAEDIPTLPAATENLEGEGEPLAPDEAQPAGIDAGTAILAAAAVPVTTVWRQDLEFSAYLEITQEPLESAGERIEEIRIIRHLRKPDGSLDTERTRRFADSEEIVEEFPD